MEVVEMFVASEIWLQLIFEGRKNETPSRAERLGEKRRRLDWCQASQVKVERLSRELTLQKTIRGVWSSCIDLLRDLNL